MRIFPSRCCWRAGLGVGFLRAQVVCHAKSLEPPPPHRIGDGSRLVCNSYAIISNTSEISCSVPLRCNGGYVGWCSFGLAVGWLIGACRVVVLLRLVGCWRFGSCPGFVPTKPRSEVPPRNAIVAQNSMKCRPGHCLVATPAPVREAFRGVRGQKKGRRRPDIHLEFRVPLVRFVFLLWKPLPMWVFFLFFFQFCIFLQ